jgi:hypothetical protein
MKTLLMILAAALFAVGCDTDNGTDAPESPACSVKATIRDKRGLDGCDFVFELPDGTLVEPLRVFWCGTPPVATPPPDPLIDFEFVDGKQVLIAYENASGVSVCMAYPMIRVTCIREVTPEVVLP